MEARFVEFNEALMALAQRLREGALSMAEFRLQRRQLLAALMTTVAAASTAGPGLERPAEPPVTLPRTEKGRSRRGTVAAAVLLLVLLLAVALFGVLA
ncbi:hypothetical protein [Nevskia ramosa]|uniref:hypothetical protein n=1 Tax=Nevskia ramosa TaxID=64002 RepID=UPI0003B591E3|nr:hypothetical protein [Nevskia ramosa]